MAWEVGSLDDRNLIRLENVVCDADLDQWATVASDVGHGVGSSWITGRLRLEMSAACVERGKAKNEQK